MSLPSTGDAAVIRTPHYTLHRGQRPLLVSLPHVGTLIPPALGPRLVNRAALLEDTDWHLESLYDFVPSMGASLLVPVHSRWVVDLNRPADDAPMYPGSNNTGLVPRQFFDGQPLYVQGQEPTPDEVAERREAHWRPYHQALHDELTRLRERHGHAVLWDGHSIRSELPWLFEGRLPDLNLGTAGGTSCSPALRDRLAAVLGSQVEYSHVLDGRFKGGHITRHYGRPAEGWHAVQMEQVWSTYMAEAPPYRPDPARMQRVQPLLRQLLEACLDVEP